MSISSVTSPLFPGTGPNGTPKVIGHVSSRPHSSAESSQAPANGAPPEHHWYDRPLGGLQAVGGLGEMAVGGALLAAPEPTGLTKVGGAIVGLHGIDDLQAGVRTAITGNPTETATQQVVTSAAQALGAKPRPATALGAVVDGGLGMANPEGEAGKIVHGAVELRDVEHAAQNTAAATEAAHPAHAAPPWSVAANRAEHEAYVDALRAGMPKPAVSDPKLRDMMDKLYRADAKVGSRSTAAAVREELKTGQPVGGRFHSEKAETMIVGLQRWLVQNPTARPGDKAAAESVIRDMQNALKGQ